MNAPERGFAPGAQALALAARALYRVREAGLNADVALDEVAPPPGERGAVRAILAGSLRWTLRLAPVVDALLQPGQKMHPQVHALLVVALHQIEYSRAAAPSVVNIAVDATRALDQRVAAGFVNALLRRYLAGRESLLARVDRSEAAASAHPRWLLREIQKLGDDLAQQVIEANNEPPPMTLRVNLARTTREQVLAELATARIEAAEGLVPTAVVLAAAVDVERLPGFAAGLVSVQDAGAQIAASRLDAQPGERVLDACAAPGGKAGHILERTPDLAELVALDISGPRLARVGANLGRLGLKAVLLQGDLLEPAWWDGRPFDRILLDAPCSATGVIRRHPDIKLLRRPEDIAGLASTQRAMLDRCVPMLAPGGRITYATCSILPAENQQVVDGFLGAHPDFSRSREDMMLLPAPRRLGPRALTDGFYYACLNKGGAGIR